VSELREARGRQDDGRLSETARWVEERWIDGRGEEEWKRKMNEWRREEEWKREEEKRKRKEEERKRKEEERKRKMLERRTQLAILLAALNFSASLGQYLSQNFRSLCTCSSYLPSRVVMS
jgi:hypothetical protein